MNWVTVDGGAGWPDAGSLRDTGNQFSQTPTNWRGSTDMVCYYQEGLPRSFVGWLQMKSQANNLYWGWSSIKGQEILQYLAKIRVYSEGKQCTSLNGLWNWPITWCVTVVKEKGVYICHDILKPKKCLAFISLSKFSRNKNLGRKMKLYFYETIWHTDSWKITVHTYICTDTLLLLLNTEFCFDPWS